LLKTLKTQGEALTKALWHLGNEIFNCEEDAKKSLKAIAKKYPLYVVESEILAQHKHAKAGRPKPGVVPVQMGYHIKTHFKLNEVEMERRLCAKGRFILATNDLDVANYTDQQILEEYKS